MGAEAYRSDGTAFRRGKELYRSDGTAFRKCKERYRYDGTAWRLIFSGFTVAAQALSSIDTGHPARVTFNSDGSVTTTDGSNGAWGAPSTAGIGSSYWIKIHFNSGNNSGFAGMAFDTWLALTAGRSISQAPNPVGERTSNLTFSISTSAADAGIVGSNSIFLYATT